MGAELHIRRGRDRAADITAAEWAAFVSESLDFVAVDSVSAVSPAGDRITVAGPAGAMANWTGHPSGVGVPFRWFSGAIHVRAGDEHVADRAVLVAAAFGAVVVDDDDNEIGAGPEPAWNFPESDESGTAPVPADPPVFGAPPPVEELPFEFDGPVTLAERVSRWFPRRRR